MNYLFHLQIPRSSKFQLNTKSFQTFLYKVCIKGKGYFIVDLTVTASINQKEAFYSDLIHELDVTQFEVMYVFLERNVISDIEFFSRHSLSF